MALGWSQLSTAFFFIHAVKKSEARMAVLELELNSYVFATLAFVSKLPRVLELRPFSARKCVLNFIHTDLFH